MDWQVGTRIRKQSAIKIGLALVVLLLCLFFTLYPSSRSLAAGLTLTDNLEIIDLPWCSADIDACEFNDGKLLIGDQVTRIGDLSSEQLASDRRLVPFGDYSPGDIVPLTIVRNGEELNLDWEISHTNVFSQLAALVVPLLIFGPFWLVGSIFLFYMQPQDSRWRLQIVFYYLVAFWLAVGLQSSTRYAYTSIILHALSWIFIPVFLEFHLTIPAPLFQRGRRYVLPLLYGITAVLALLELFQRLSTDAYLLGVMVAVLCSMLLLGYRSFNPKQSAERISARIMLAGVALALGPGLLLWLVPILFSVYTPGEVATSISILAIPILPLFYGYAVYKRSLGLQEQRVNRFLGKYALFLMYLIIFTIAVLAIGMQSDQASRTLIFALITIMAFLLSALPLNEAAKKMMSRIAYGSYYDKEETTLRFANQIAASADRAELVQLIVGDLCPTLLIRQSTLFSLIYGQVDLLYDQGTNFDSTFLTQEEINHLLDFQSTYISASSPITTQPAAVHQWLRVAIPLIGRSELIGFWLFGDRDPDDYYTQNDIEILSILAKQLAITIENGQLFIALQKQLAERKAAEEQLSRYAERLGLLHQLDQSMLTADTPLDIANAALEGLVNIVKCSRASVTNMDAASSNLSVLATCETRPDFQQDNVPEFQEPVDYLNGLESNELWILEDIETLDDDFPFIHYLRDLGLVTILSAPLHIDGRLLGSLNIAYDKVTKVSSEQKAIAREVANSLVLAIQNAKLRDTITRHSHELKQLSTRLITAQETERKRISYELHDEIGQILTAVMFDLVAIEQEVIGIGSLPLEKRLADARFLVEQLMGQVRSMSLELRPSMLQELGLVPTLRWYVNTYADRREMLVEFDVLEVGGQLSEDVEIAIYRIIQEALTNVSRHAQASCVSLYLHRSDGVLTGSIEDDGIGFNVQNAILYSTPASGVGLLAMRERVTSLNGRFDLQSTIGDGTRVWFEIPVGK